LQAVTAEKNHHQNEYQRWSLSFGAHRDIQASKTFDDTLIFYSVVEMI